MSADYLSQHLFTAFTLLPYAAGLIFALATVQRHPRASALAALGCAVVLLVGVGMTAFQAVALPGAGFDLGQYRLVLSGAGVVRVVGICLILAAVFIDRRVPTRPPFEEDAPLPVPHRDDPRIQPR